MVNLNWFDIITSTMVAGGGLYAAYAASQSAKSTNAAIVLAKETENRALRRQLNFVSCELLAESQRVKELAQQLKIEQVMLSRASGLSNNSSEIIAIRNIDGRITIINQIASDAKYLVHKFSHILTASEEDIANTLTKLENQLIQVRAERFRLEEVITYTVNEKNRFLEKFNK